MDAAAAYLTIGTTTIYKAIQQRQLKHTRFGKSIRISHDYLTDWITEQTKPTINEIQERLNGRKIKRKQPIRRFRRGRPPLWPPETDASMRRLAQRIEQNMLKG